MRDEAGQHRLKLAIVAVAAALLLVMPQLKLLALRTSFYDLGQYASVIYAIGFDDEIGAALRGHAHLLILPYVWLYRVLPYPAVLLAVQSAILIATALLAGRLWEAYGGGRPLDGALVYMLSISVWFNALFDFHFEHLVFPLLFAAMLASSRNESVGRTAIVLGCGVLLCFVKETYALSACGLGLYLIAIGDRRSGIALSAFAIVYFLVMTSRVIPCFTDGLGTGELWRKGFGHWGDSMGQMLISIVGRPWAVVIEVFSSARKLIFVAALGGAFAFAFIRTPLALLPAVPIIAIALLSRNPSHYYLGNQYTAGIVAPLFVATAITIGRAAPEHRTFLLNAVLAGSAIVLIAFGPAPVSRLFLSSGTWSYQASAYLPSHRDFWTADVIARTVPAGSVVSTQNSVNTSVLSNRRLLLAFPDGVWAPKLDLDEPRARTLLGAIAIALLDGKGAQSRPLTADWVVIDRGRPWFVNDTGCEWRAGVCTDASVATSFEQELSKLPADFDAVFDEAGLSIWRRRSRPGP